MSQTKDLVSDLNIFADGTLTRENRGELLLVMAAISIHEKGVDVEQIESVLSQACIANYL